MKRKVIGLLLALMLCFCAGMLAACEASETPAPTDPGFTQSEESDKTPFPI